MKQFFCILTLFFCAIGLRAELNEKALYDAYLANDFETWQSQISQAADSTCADLEKLINYEYGFIGFCFSRQQEDAAKNALARAQKHLEKLAVCGYNEAMLNMYRSAFAAFELATNPAKFATLGLQCIKLANLAWEQAPKNPYILNLKANTDFYRPAIVGGSKKRAVQHFEESVKQFEQQNLTENNWNYIAAMLTLAQAYEKTDDLENAKKLCDKILKIAPDFLYLRDIYYPVLLKK